MLCPSCFETGPSFVSGLSHANAHFRRPSEGEHDILGDGGDEYTIRWDDDHPLHTRVLAKHIKVFPRAVPETAVARPAQRPSFASRSVRRALLLPQVHPGSLYRCGRSH